MAELLLGSYVRCPIDEEYPENPRVFVVGQVAHFDQESNQVEVVFHDPAGARRFYCDLPGKKTYDSSRVVRCTVLEGAPCRVSRGRLLGTIAGLGPNAADGGHTYFLKLPGGGTAQQFHERQLEISLLHGNRSPAAQLADYELHSPFWYRQRSVVANSVHVLRNATFGFETLVGSRTYLLPHQVDTIVRAVAQSPCRLMLADEVGLGKTIEASVIMKGLKERSGCLRTLLVVPASIVRQWRNELSSKFWLDFPLWNEESAFSGTDMILPLEEADTPKGRSVIAREWDLCIVDETHRLLALPSEYGLLYGLSQRTPNILLLSATPIQQRRVEYRRLLALLEPRRYGEMTEDEFDLLLEKQGVLRERVHSLMRDLDEYLSEDLVDDYLAEFKEIDAILQDGNFSRLIRSIDPSAEDRGLSFTKLALAYIGENYQLERHILRHRRQELKDRMPRRSVVARPYSQVGASQGYFESDAYESLLRYLEWLGDSCKGGYNEVDSYAVELLAAMFSSPWALEAVLRRQVNFNGEGPAQELLRVTKRWTDAVANELSSPLALHDDPDTIKGRLGHVVDYLLETVDGEKYVIFSSWTETAVKLKETLCIALGETAVTGFHRGMDDAALQAAADRFQSDPGCRFMVCDDLGGEGRNFQIAEEILHVDLPWSPVDLEQRIGRLDRIGRDRDVISVVFFAADTIEEDLFALWRDGLKIFEESLSGLEIGLPVIQAEIIRNLGEDIRYGLRQALQVVSGQADEMRRQVEAERYFDMARHLDRRVEHQLSTLIGKFDDAGGKSLEETMLAWTPSVGLKVERNCRVGTVSFRESGTSLKAMANAMLIPPDLTKAHHRGRRGYLSGTFSRQLAILREDIMFYAPGDELFDSLVRNADICYRGRCCAYAMESELPHDWRGFVFTWSIGIHPLPLLSLGEGIENLAVAGGYVPLEQLITLEGFSEEDRELDELLNPQELVFGVNPKRVWHLGQRNPGACFHRLGDRAGSSNSQKLRQEFPAGQWRIAIKESYDRQRADAMDRFRKLTALEQAKCDFERRLNGLRAASIYYGRNDGQVAQEYLRSKNIFQALLRGLEKPQIRLDSAAFVWLVPRNG